MIDLNALEIFVAAAEKRSFSRAAVGLGLAQPTVSRVIKDLEVEWGEPVFYRTGRGVELSEFGHVAYLKAKTLLREAEQVSQDLREASRRPAGQVAIGIPPSMVGAVIPDLALGLSLDEPGIKLRVREGFSDQIERWLADGSVEIGLVSKYREIGQLTEPAIFSSPLVLARAKSHGPLPDTLNFADIEGKPLVLPMHPNGLRVALETVSRRMKFSLNIFVDAESIVAQKLVAERCGCYMVKAAQTLSEDGSVEKFASSVIVNPGIQRYVVMQTSQQRPLTKAAREVTERITAIMRQISREDVAHRTP
ncbi:LysR family transcriptional regulator [Oricola sp.]|uniref:LysR family transcriptional regulator n=1 Tax=Oricola sp. TaxID=1979950 RepID=UPI0025E333CD|nr:LysR family transcriptional regulator [Oricola sp.]MCI5076556.1 LysR family transcriptional regulator [Oricola sp.]